MATLTLSNEQVVELVKQLPQEGKQAVLDALSYEHDIWWDLTLSQGEERLRQLYFVFWNRLAGNGFSTPSSGA